MNKEFRFTKNLKLETKINIVTILVMGSLLLIMIFVLNRSLMALARQVGQERVREEVEVISNHFAEIEQEVLAGLKLVATTPQLAEAVAAHDRARIRTQMLVGAAPFDFDRIDLIDLDGEFLVAGMERRQSGKQDDQKLLSLALLGIEATAITVAGEMEPELHLTAAVPLKDDSGKVIGGLIASRIIDQELLARTNFSRTGIHILLVYNGQLVAQHVSHEQHDQTKDHGNNLPDATGQAVSGANVTLSNLIDQTAVEQALTGRVVIAEEFIHLDADDSRHSVAYMPVIIGDNIKAVAVILFNLGQLEKFESQLAGSLSIVFTILALIALGVSAFLIRKNLITPLDKLTIAAKQMTDGNLSARAQLTSSDEIGLLATSFNAMAVRLQQILTGLEQRVEERTAKLTATNERFLREIVEREQIKEALRTSEERLRHVFSSISDHIYLTEITEAGQRINRYLSPTEALTGYPLEKIMSDWTFWPCTMIYPDDRAAAAEQANRFTQGQNSEVEYRLTRADGNIIWVRDSGRVERDPISNNLLVSGIVSDITERKQAELALAQAHDQALEASRLKSELLARVSHELRTPLGAISGYIELLQDGVFGSVSDQQIEITGKVIESANFLTKLVDELLDQAQLDRGRIKLEISTFSLRDAIHQVKAKMQVLAETKGLSLSINIAPEVPDLISSDKKRIQQIMINLIGNAIKFTKEGSVQVRLSSPKSSYWVIEVADTGPGISEEAQEYIFEAFRQVDGSITRKYGGSGLGLSIVKELSTMMGGDVTVESELGQGSIFTVWLPLTIKEKQQEQDKPESYLITGVNT